MNQTNTLRQTPNMPNIEFYLKNHITEHIQLLEPNSIGYLIFHNKIKDIKKIIKDKPLLLNKADNSPYFYTWTPLYWSVKFRRLECIKILLELGADINLVINDCDECCGTVLDLATLRNDTEIQLILKNHAEKKDVDLSQSFRAIRTKLRGKTPAFDFRSQKNRT